MAIKLIQDGVMGQTRTYLQASSTTIVANTLCTFASGYLTPAVAWTTELRVLALQGSVAGSGEHPAVLCVDLNEQHTLECDTAVNTSQAIVGTKVDLTDAATAINATGATTKVLRIVGVVGAAADKKILAKIVSKDA